jgi:polyadenylate-binding protein
MRVGLWSVTRRTACLLAANTYHSDTATTQEEFDGLFKPFGPVVSCALQFDEAGKNKGFGFVNYEQHEDARKAVDQLDDSEFKGKKLFVSRAQKRSERDEELRRNHEAARMEQESKNQGVNLYVKNINGKSAYRGRREGGELCR